MVCGLGEGNKIIHIISNDVPKNVKKHSGGNVCIILSERTRKRKKEINTEISFYLPWVCVRNKKVQYLNQPWSSF